MTTATATAIKQQYLSPDYSAIEHQSLNPYDSTSSPSESSLEVLDDIEFELERIMFVEFTQGLPSDIPMADF